MPVFSYITKDIEGKYHKGEVEATDARQVASLLRRKKLIIISIKTQNSRNSTFMGKFFSRVPFSAVVVVTRQLATMIQAGLVLSEALDILEDQQENKVFKQVLKNVATDIKGGLDFATALEKHPEVFPDIYSKLVRAGQASGKMDTVLIELADNLEKEREFKSKVKGAMIYPIVVISMMVGVMMIMIFFVMPKLMSMYKDSGIELPLPTKIMLGFAGFVISYWWAILTVLIAGAITFKHYVSSPVGRYVVDKFMIRMPVVGKIASQVIMTNFTRTFGLLVSSGLSILDSIKIVSQIVGNKVYQTDLEMTYKGVERGLSFSSQILSLPTFPRIVGQMVKTGEETGKLDEIMSKLADYFESEADNSLKNITTLIEPIILVILGLGVGLLVVSIIMPIYQLTTSIK